MRASTGIPITRRRVLAGAAAVPLAGCAGGLIGPPSPPPQIYLLDPPLGGFEAPPVSWQLVVAPPIASAVLDTQRIALTRSPNTMDYFANAEWTDRVPVLVQSLLVQAFERSAKIRAVGRETAGIRADYVLESEIRHFEAYYAVPDTPPKVRVDFTVKMLGALSHEMAGMNTVTHESQAALNDMPSITAAFAQAAGPAVEEAAAWALRTGRA